MQIIGISANLMHITIAPCEWQKLDLILCESGHQIGSPSSTNQSLFRSYLLQEGSVFSSPSKWQNRLFMKSFRNIFVKIDRSVFDFSSDNEEEFTNWSFIAWWTNEYNNDFASSMVTHEKQNVFLPCFFWNFLWLWK